MMIDIDIVRDGEFIKITQRHNPSNRSSRELGK